MDQSVAWALALMFWLWRWLSSGRDSISERLSQGGTSIAHRFRYRKPRQGVLRGLAFIGAVSATPWLCVSKEPGRNEFVESNADVAARDAKLLEIGPSGFEPPVFFPAMVQMFDNYAVESAARVN
ncbi:MAG: hypothetical protein ACLP4V_31560 [Methylocella sp.]